MMTSQALRQVKRGSLCTGCGLCAGVSSGAVSMMTQDPGYSRPVQTAALSNTAERAIEECCPGLNVAPWDNPLFEGATIHPSWGPYHQCLTGYATDEEVRHRGSSGGAISALAIHALESGMARRVVHIGADPDHPTRNVVTVSRAATEVLGGSGSRYAASSPLEQIERLLADGVPGVFVGKPCDISALRQLATRDSRVDAMFPLKLSFFCGGIPSHDGADRIVRSMGLDPSHLVSFRYRGEGWPGLTVAQDDTGRRGEMPYGESWGAHLSKEVQFRCKICPDAVGGLADIACADAWYGGETGYPQFEEADGRSLIMTRTDVGQNLLKSALAARKIEVVTLPVADVDLMQPAQARRKRRILARLAACRLLLRPVPKMAGLCVKQSAAQERLRISFKELLGTARRILLRQL